MSWPRPWTAGATGCGPTPRPPTCTCGPTRTGRTCTRCPSCPPGWRASASASPRTANAPRAATSRPTSCRRRCASASGWCPSGPARSPCARSPRWRRCHVQLLPRAERARFEDDGPTGADTLHDVLRRLAAVGAARPAIWVRTAPPGATAFCWRIDIVPRGGAGRRPDGGRGREPDGAGAGGRGGQAARRLALDPLACAPMPPSARPIPAFAAQTATGAPPLRPLGPGPDRALPRGRPRAWSPRRTLASRAKWSGSPTAPGAGAPTSRPPRPPRPGSSCSATWRTPASTRARRPRTSPPPWTGPTRPPRPTPTGAWTSPTRRSPSGAAPTGSVA